MTQNQALEILKTGVNVFLTGEPGSGKTYTINQYIAYLRSHSIEPAITASTGIAATHIGGMTIHSWSGIGIATFLDKYDLDRIASNKYVLRRVENSKVLVIDEVSMILPQTLSMVDAVCREVKRNQLPFGGLQVIFVGDFFQLPPIQSASAKSYGGSAEAWREGGRAERTDMNIFAYGSQAWASAHPVICYLTEQFRHSDKDFNLLLNAIRSNQFNGEHLTHLEKRIIVSAVNLENIPKLFSHNADVDRVNEDQLNKILGQPKVFLMTSRGRNNLVEGLKKSCLSPEKLGLKVNAAVMFTKNNPKEGFVNGTLGKIIGFDSHSGYPIVKTYDNQKITVSPADWSIQEGERVLAVINQIPLRLAWAITVHKSQGMTLDAAVMDLRQVFEFGQGYVALSRVRALSGLYLLGWNDRTFQVHPQVLEADKIFRAHSKKIEEDLSKVAVEEMQKIQNNFILASGGKLEIEPVESARGPKVKTDTIEETLRLWNENKNAAEIAEARGLTVGTILGHVGKLFARGKINQADLNRLLTDEIKSALPQIHAAFQELTAEHLSPIFEKFQGAYSYNDLRIARMMFKK